MKDDPYLRPGQFWVRKRDGVCCMVEVVTRSTVDYCTRPMLLVYKVRRLSFLKNFRWVGSNSEEVSR